MALQLILGPSGSGKSYYIYNKIIDESVKNPKTNYILLVPEQYSMALQRKMVMLHRAGGTMNIDVIGFNRLAYRVFDELLIKPTNVLEDFGKSMIIRQVAGQIKNDLKIYGGCLDKNGFVDETKSLMSEIYQYDIDRARLQEVLNNMKAGGENLLTDKLSDMLAIFRAFEEKISGDYIVAEQITELLADVIERSELIKNSVVIMDGFTGFTPVQLKLVRELMKHAKDIYAVITIDEKSVDKNTVSEHELFYLSRQTIDNLRALAKEVGITIKPDIFTYVNDRCRWDKRRSDIIHLEQNIFRFPYNRYNAEPENISITAYNNPITELTAVAQRIYSLVNEEGYRYKDIAIVSGDLLSVDYKVKHIFSRYDIPYFVDQTIPVKNNAYIDAIGHVLRIVNEDFSYDSVFSFLKSGLVRDVSIEDIEELENYVLERGVRGRKWWEREWKCEADESRKIIMEILSPFAKALGRRKHTVLEYIAALRNFMEVINYEEGMADTPHLYESLSRVLDKMEQIMPSDTMNIDEFREILDVGLKELSLGRIPSCLDMVMVGDIIRTRLEDIKILFIIGLNDGIIPKKGASSQIINDNEKETLSKLGINLAPTDKLNSFIEQFYLYLNMTKASDRLYISYTLTSDSGEEMRPSYVVSRLEKVFPSLVTGVCKNDRTVSSMNGSVGVLISGLRELLEGDNTHINETLSLYKLYMDLGDKKLLYRIDSALNYNNIPDNLADEAAKLIRMKCVSQSVSRIEKYAECAYAYFLKYVLGINERKLSLIDNRGVGIVLHTVMERLYRHVHDNLGNDWSMLDDKTRDDMVTKFTYQVFDENYEDEGKNGYLREVFARIGRRTASVMSRVTSDDGFVPEYFEYKFNKRINIEDKGYELTINGIVDRGDVYYSPSDNRLKLRIIDYKSGNYDFDVTRLYDGLQLQLSVYMYIMQDLAKEYKTVVKNNAEVVPEGMYYYQMKDPIVEAKDEKEADEERGKKLKLMGLNNEEPDKFEAAVNYSIKKIVDIADKILDGHIEKNPVWNSGVTACDYCEYKNICRFDNKYGGNRYRYLTFKDKDKAFDKIMEELGGGDNGLD